MYRPGARFRSVNTRNVCLIDKLTTGSAWRDVFENTFRKMKANTRTSEYFLMEHSWRDESILYQFQLVTAKTFLYFLTRVLINILHNINFHFWFSFRFSFFNEQQFFAYFPVKNNSSCTFRRFAENKHFHMTFRRYFKYSRGRRLIWRIL